MSDSKPACKYGSKCYRLSSKHKDEFSHPESATSSSTSTGAPPPKRQKMGEGSALFTAAGSESNKEMCPVAQINIAKICSKYMLYMTYIHRGIDLSFNQGSALTLHSK